MANAETAMEALMGRLYTNLTDASDAAVTTNERERFISWCLPGIPIAPEELRFVSRGLVGIGENATAAGQDTALLLQQASTFARLVDFTADATSIFGAQQQRASFQSDAKSMSRTYERVLRQSQVVKTELTEAEKQTLERIRNELYPERQITDSETGVTETRRLEGPRLINYKRAKKEYDAAVEAFNNALIAATVGGSPEAVMRFARGGDALRKDVQIAAGAWAAAGEKNTVERDLATVAAIGQRDMTLWKADVVDRFERGKMLDPSGQQFWWTSLTPAGFLSPDAGWTTFEFTESEIAQYSRVKHRKWDAGGKFGIGRFSIGANAGGSSDMTREVKDVTNLSISMEIAQIPLVYSWFDETFVDSRAWRFAPDAVEAAPLSDGGDPPKGAMVAYPTSVIFIRNAVVNFKELHDESSDISKTLKAGGSAGWGVFPISGNYERNEQTKTMNSTVHEEGIKVGGLQIIGFRCRLLHGKVPNELEGVEWSG